MAAREASAVAASSRFDHQGGGFGLPPFNQPAGMQRAIMSPTKKRLTDQIPIIRYAAHAPILLELPAPVCVCSLLVVAALTKHGHSQWAIGGMMLLYLLYVTAQYAKWNGPPFARTPRARRGEFTSAAIGSAGSAGRSDQMSDQNCRACCMATQ
jgi:hypothetical protein